MIGLKKSHNKGLYIFGKKIKKSGFDYACVTSGGILPITNIKFKPGYQVF